MFFFSRRKVDSLQYTVVKSISKSWLTKKDTFFLLVSSERFELSHLNTHDRTLLHEQIMIAIPTNKNYFSLLLLSRHWVISDQQFLLLILRLRLRFQFNNEYFTIFRRIKNPNSQLLSRLFSMPRESPLRMCINSCSLRRKNQIASIIHLTSGMMRKRKKKM